jgi:hypothetical protein
MKRLKECPAISARLSSPCPTARIDENTLATTQRDLQQRLDGWQQVIDRQLVEWGKAPQDLQDDGLKAPSLGIIAAACKIASACRDAGWAPPLRAVPTGAGGIVFERRVGPVFETLEIRADGTVEQATYNNSRLCSRRRLS